MLSGVRHDFQLKRKCRNPPQPHLIPLPTPPPWLIERSIWGSPVLSLNTSWPKSQYKCETKQLERGEFWKCLLVQIDWLSTQQSKPRPVFKQGPSISSWTDRNTIPASNTNNNTARGRKVRQEGYFLCNPRLKLIKFSHTTSGSVFIESPQTWKQWAK